MWGETPNPDSFFKKFKPAIVLELFGLIFIRQWLVLDSPNYRFFI